MKEVSNPTVFATISTVIILILIVMPVTKKEEQAMKEALTQARKAYLLKVVKKGSLKTNQR